MAKHISRNGVDVGKSICNGKAGGIWCFNPRLWDVNTAPGLVGSAITGTSAATCLRDGTLAEASMSRKPPKFVARFKKYAEDFVVRELDGDTGKPLQGCTVQDVPHPDAWSMDQHYVKPRGISGNLADKTGQHRVEKQEVTAKELRRDCDSYRPPGGDGDTSRSASCVTEATTKLHQDLHRVETGEKVSTTSSVSSGDQGSQRKTSIYDLDGKSTCTSVPLQKEPQVSFREQVAESDDNSVNIGTRKDSLEKENADAVLEVFGVNPNREQETLPAGKKAKWTPRHLWFTVAKRHRTSEEARSLIAKHLGVSTERISYAGLKDRRGITFQFMSVRAGDEARKLEKRLYSFRDTYIKIGQVQPRPRHCALGSQAGNHFQVGLRNVQVLVRPDGAQHLHHVQQDTSFRESIENRQKESPEGTSTSKGSILLLAQERAAQVAQFGFLNYFGPQRFGTGSVLSSDVGRACIQGDYETACRLVIHSLKTENPRAEEAAVAFDGGNYEEALKLTAHSRLAERNLLRVLHRTGGNFEKALREGIPRCMRLFYARAYVSLLWNQAVSLRCQDISALSGSYGATGFPPSSDVDRDSSFSPPADRRHFALPLGDSAADLVLLDGGNTKNTCVKVRDRVEEDESSLLFSSGHDQSRMESSLGARSSALGHSDAYRDRETPGFDHMEVTLPRVRRFDSSPGNSFQAGQKAGADRVEDIVVPIVGSENVVLTDYWHSVYTHLLEGRDPRSVFDSCAHREFRVEGGYRKLFAFPKNVSVEIPVEEKVKHSRSCLGSKSTTGVLYTSAQKEDAASSSQEEKIRDPSPCDAEKIKDRLLFAVPEIHGPLEAIARKRLRNPPVSPDVREDGKEQDERTEEINDSTFDSLQSKRSGQNLIVSFSLDAGQYASVCLREMFGDEALQGGSEAKSHSSLGHVEAQAVKPSFRQEPIATPPSKGSNVACAVC
ncbi:unnamed protein product [Amoebophrya sp. A120]|nr:unnamed protein product [Amoebophrya sp. A120]|eukprot:GSA120T00001687001.1